MKTCIKKICLLVIFTLSLNMLFAQTYISSRLKKSICFFFFLVFFSEFLLAQKESSYWYFGDNCGLRFSDSNVTVLNDGQLTAPACASISDRFGNLLFYTDGNTVWNRYHNIMGNGNNISVYNKSLFNFVCIIVPCPNDTQIYYIFNIGIHICPK